MFCDTKQICFVDAACDSEIKILLICYSLDRAALSITNVFSCLDNKLVS